MKLFGAKRRGRHLQESVGNDSPAAANGAKDKNTKVRRGPKRWIKIAIISVVVVAVAVIGAFALDLITGSNNIIRPPDVNQVPRPSRDRVNSSTQADLSSNSPGRVLQVDTEYERFFTFLIFGLDEGGLTDVIMAATLDIEEKSLNVVSIPRDTLVNVPWSLRMANSILPNMRHRYRNETNADVREELAMQATVEMFADVLGFEVDFWFTVNMRAFKTLIDAVGGVDFYIPVRMNYRDNYAGLHINFNKGMHYGLTGQQSLELLRFRSFGTGDIGRINVQQQFLSAAVEQILAKRSTLASLSNLTDLADIAFNQINTNVDSALHLLWFAQQFFELEPENIRFATIPHVLNDFIVNRGYVVIVLDEWLEMLNEMLNPFMVEKTAEDLSVLSRGADRRLFSSDGNWADGNANWGSGSRGPAQPQGGGSNLTVTGGGGGGGTAGSGAGNRTTTSGGTQTTAPPRNGTEETPGDDAADSENQELNPDESIGEDVWPDQVPSDDTDSQYYHGPPDETDYPQIPGGVQLPEEPNGDAVVTEPTDTQEDPIVSQPPESPQTQPPEEQNANINQQNVVINQESSVQSESDAENTVTYAVSY